MSEESKKWDKKEKKEKTEPKEEKREIPAGRPLIDYKEELYTIPGFGEIIAPEPVAQISTPKGPICDVCGSEGQNICEFCKGTFCSHHFEPEDHNCPEPKEETTELLRFKRKPSERRVTYHHDPTIILQKPPDNITSKKDIQAELSDEKLLRIYQNLPIEFHDQIRREISDKKRRGKKKLAAVFLIVCVFLIIIGVLGLLL